MCSSSLFIFFFLILFLHSYLADQCWNGGCIYLIMLRRIKRKAPLPPCNGSSGGNCVDVSNEHRRNVSNEPVGSPTQNGQNGKRTRKFGVISRSSFTRDSKDSKDSRDFEHENGYSSMEAEVTSPESSTPQDTPTDDSPFIGSSEVISNHLKLGSTATLPSRLHSRLSESYKTESISSEPSSQVRIIKYCRNIKNIKCYIKNIRLKYKIYNLSYTDYGHKMSA